MDKPCLVADMFSEIGEKGDDVMLGLALNLIDAIDFPLATLPDGLGGILWNDPQLSLRITGMGFDFKPDTELVLRFPNVCHIGAAIAGNHRLYLCFVC